MAGGSEENCDGLEAAAGGGESEDFNGVYFAAARH